MNKRKVAMAMVAAGIVMLVSPVAVWAQADRFGGFYNLRAEANGFGVIFGNPSTQPYPTAAMQIPQTAADLSNGPQAHALAAVGWPGPLIGNAGGLASVVFPICSPDGACLPKPSDEAIGLANYPLRAEAFSPGGGQRSDELGPLEARAIDDDSEAKAAIADFDAEGVISAGRVTTRSHSFLEVGRGTSVAETVVTNVVAAGEQVKFKSLRTLSRASTDGIRTTVEREIVVEGLEIGGRSAAVDEKGVRFTDGASGPANEEILANFGIEMFITKPFREQSSGGEARLASGALAINWKLGDSGQHVLITFGGAQVHVQGQGAILPPGTSDTGSDFGPFTTDTRSETPVGDGGSRAVDVSPATVDAGPTTSMPDAAPSDIAALPPVRPASGFGGIAPGWFVVSIIGALLAGMGLQRARVGILAKDPKLVTACPLERR